MNSKHILQSKTFYSILLIALPMLYKAAGLELTDAGSAELASQLMTIAGVIGAVWGRASASTKLRLKPRSSTGFNN